MNAPKKILITPLNWGLGHATRCIPIIKALEQNNFEPIIASDGVALALLKKEFPHLTCLELPAYNIEYATNGRNFKWELLTQMPKMFSAIRKEKKAIQNIIEKYKIGDELGELFDVKPIYYESNKFTLTRESKKELDRVAIVLQDNKGLSVELGSHTDSKGSDETNLTLSKNRAQAVYDYLVTRGVSKSRLSFKGYGETKLKNRCKNGVNCSDAEHQKNRRTEYRVSKIVPCSETIVEEDPILTSEDTKSNEEGGVNKNNSNEVADNNSAENNNADRNNQGDLNAGPITCGDADGDKIPDYLDQDSDNDGIPDAAEGHGDADKDGLPNCIDKDSDNDGIADAIEKSVDFDKDGKSNMIDTDSDNDGIKDEEEGVKDFDKDGNPNYLE